MESLYPNGMYTNIENSIKSLYPMEMSVPKWKRSFPNMAKFSTIMKSLYPDVHNVMKSLYNITKSFVST